MTVGLTDLPPTKPKTPVNSRYRRSTVMAVEHAIDVLRCLCGDTEKLGVNEIARRIGLHKSSVSRLLATLETAHLVERDPAINKFKIGIGMIGLAAPLISNFGLLEIAPPYLEGPAKDSGETISLNIWDGHGAVCVKQVPGSNSITHYAPPGMHNPAHCTAAGKVLFAHAPQKELARILADELTPYTKHTTVSQDILQAQLKQIRRRGYAVNEGEFHVDVGAVAWAVRGIEGKVVAAIAATVPMYRFDKQCQGELIQLLGAAAEKFSQRMGYVTGSSDGLDS